MKRLFYIFVILFSFSFFFSCKTIKGFSKEKDSISVDTSKWVENDSLQKIIIKELTEKIVTIKDSLINVQLAYEKSKNTLSDFLSKNDTSRVETSFAFSLAWIDGLGILNHQIENKKQALVNVPVIKETEKHEKDSSNTQHIVNKDSTNISSNHNSIKEDKEIIYIQPTFKQKAGYVGWGVLIGFLLTIILYLVLKNFKNKLPFKL